jgi:hypothetical protein
MAAEDEAARLAIDMAQGGFRGDDAFETQLHVTSPIVPKERLRAVQQWSILINIINM